MMNIIGDDMLPKNVEWIEKLAEFIKDVHNNYKHIKLIGIQFGSHLIAYALGGKIAKIPSLPESQSIHISKEEIKFNQKLF